MYHSILSILLIVGINASEFPNEHSKIAASLIYSRLVIDNSHIAYLTINDRINRVNPIILNSNNGVFDNESGNFIKEFISVPKSISKHIANLQKVTVWHESIANGGDPSLTDFGKEILALNAQQLDKAPKEVQTIAPIMKMLTSKTNVSYDDVVTVARFVESSTNRKQ